MFWFQHPRPPSRKEIAEQVATRKQAAPEVRVLIVENKRATTSTPAPPALPPPEKRD